jgi:predicted O-methyltransferase YrrM
MMTGLIAKVVHGRGRRRTRFHDEKGNLLDLGGFAYVPLTAVEQVARMAFGYMPVAPKISRRAARLLDRLIRPSWTVVEFGSGMSTVWFAERAGAVISIETVAGWRDRVLDLLAERGLTNVRLHLRDGQGDGYADLSMLDDGTVDFALVDGEVHRADAMRAAIRKVRAGGYIYLDNCDDDRVDQPDGDIAWAERLLIDAVRERGGRLRYFTDVPPTSVVATQGMLARL